MFALLAAAAIIAHTPPPKIWPAWKDGKAGFVDAAGHVVVDFQFDRATEIQNGMAQVEKDKKVGFVDENGKLVIPTTFDPPEVLELSRYGFSEGVSPAKKSGKWGYIDRHGYFVIPPVFAKAGKFSEGLAAVDDGKKAGVARDDGGKDSVSQIQAAFAEMSSGHFGYVDHTGKFVIPAKFEAAEAFSHGIAPASVGGKWGMIDRHGRFVTAPQFERIDDEKEGFRIAVFKKYERETFLDVRGHPAFGGKVFEHLFDFSEGLASVTIDRKSGYIDVHGRTVIAPQYSVAGSFREGFADVELDDDHSGFVDRTGKVVGGELKYRNVHYFAEGLAAVDVSSAPAAALDGKDRLADFTTLYERKTNGLWGYVDGTGATVIAPAFQKAQPFRNGQAPVAIEGKWGVIDRDGKWVIPARYESLYSAGPSFWRISGKGQSVTTLDRNGHTLWSATRAAHADVADAVGIRELRLAAADLKNDGVAAELDAVQSQVDSGATADAIATAHPLVSKMRAKLEELRLGSAPPPETPPTPNDGESEEEYAARLAGPAPAEPTAASGDDVLVARAVAWRTARATARTAFREQVNAVAAGIAQTLPKHTAWFTPAPVPAKIVAAFLSSEWPTRAAECADSFRIGVPSTLENCAGAMLVDYATTRAMPKPSATTKPTTTKKTKSKAKPAAAR